jgi:hypothetical protein
LIDFAFSISDEKARRGPCIESVSYLLLFNF